MPAPVLLPHDLLLLNRLKGNIDASERGIIDAQAQLTRASIAAQAAGAAMNVFMEHLAEVYGLKPQDVIDAQGTIHLLDPGWAVEAAARRQAEAAEAAPPAEEATSEAPATEATPLPGEAAPEVEVPAAVPPEEVRVTRVEEEEPEILPLAVPEPVRRQPARRNSPKAH